MPVGIGLMKMGGRARVITASRALAADQETGQLSLAAAVEKWACHMPGQRHNHSMRPAQNPEASDDEELGMTEDAMWTLLMNMGEGAEIGKIIATLRPQRDELSQRLDAWLDLFTANLLQNTATAALPLVQAQEQRRLALDSDDDGEPDDDVELDAWRAEEGNPAADDLAAWRLAGWPEDILQPYREQDDGPVLRFAHRIIDSAVDHLLGVAILMGDDRVNRPPLSLSRVVLDATAHLHYVLERDIDPEERMLRVLNELLARHGEDYRAAQREQDQSRMDEATEAINQIRDVVGSRWTGRWAPDRGPAPYIGDKPTYTSKLIDNMLGGGGIWSELSGVVHNKEDDGWRMMLGLRLGIDNVHKDQYLALYALGAVLGMVRLVDVIEAYTGWDLSATRQWNDPVCNLWAAGAGMMDDHYREQAVQQRRDDGSTERMARHYAEARVRIDADEALKAADTENQS